MGWLACGAGRHALALAPRVASITGVDFTEVFLITALGDAAKQGIKNVEFIQGDMRELDYDACFDAAYNYFTAWGYYSDAENFDVLQRVGIHPAKDVLDLVPRVWKTKFANNPLKSDLSIPASR